MSGSARSPSGLSPAWACYLRASEQARQTREGLPRDLNQRLRTWESVGLRTVSSTLTITLFSRTEFFTCHRFLAFSPSPIESTFVEIDGSPLELPATQVEGPLFACQWDPDKYSSGIHSMTVKVQVHYYPRFFQSREKTLTHCLNTPLE